MNSKIIRGKKEDVIILSEGWQKFFFCFSGYVFGWIMSSELHNHRNTTEYWRILCIKIGIFNMIVVITITLLIIIYLVHLIQ